MAFEPINWSTTELQIYILLLAANADGEETQEEIDLIKSKVSKETYEKIYKEFHQDSKKKRLKKIERNIHQHDFSTMELMNFRKEVSNIFFLDGNFKIMEQRLDLLLDNMLY